MICHLLSDKSERDWQQVNLDEIACKDLSAPNDNPMKEPAYQDEWLKHVQQNICGGRPTYGGFLENRSFLWRGFENSKHMLHLGVDVNNLEPGAEICAPADLEIFHIFKDEAKRNGWGARIIAKLDIEHNGAQYLLLGHLDAATVPKVGQRFRKDDTIAILGNPDNNGGWSTHLHVQLNKQKFIERFKEDLDKLDGYALTDEEVQGVYELVADPTNFIFTL